MLANNFFLGLKKKNKKGKEILVIKYELWIIQLLSTNFSLFFSAKNFIVICKQVKIRLIKKALARVEKKVKSSGRSAAREEMIVLKKDWVIEREV